jgi:aryl-alcohol dehydrogenase-like predicted oxidoreductase
MALAFVHTRPFVTSTVVGATTMEQLKENIGSLEVDLSDAVLEGIAEIHNSIPNPAP